MAKRSSKSSASSKGVVDAHALIWYLEGGHHLGANARRFMDDQANVLFLPVIALAEACWAVERRRTGIPSVSTLLGHVDADPRIRIVELDRRVHDFSLTLTTITEMHDRLIVATCIYLGRKGKPVPLLTADREITASGLVPIIW